MDPPRFNIISFLLFIAGIGLGTGIAVLWNNPWASVVGSILGCIAAMAPQIAQQWERAVVLRLGKYNGLHGPGLFWIIPGIDRVSSWIDQRIITTTFAAEQTLTADTVPVNVDAVLFWMVYDPRESQHSGPGLPGRGELGGERAASATSSVAAADDAPPRPRADPRLRSRS